MMVIAMSTSVADPLEALPLFGSGEEPSEVAGGELADSGVWPDAAGIVFYGSYVGCTGVLVAPDVVLTAGHCVGGISHVIVGSTNVRSNEGETIAVKAVYEYADSWSTHDIAVLTLWQDSVIPPRQLALDCIRDEQLVDGADVAVVGFGSIDYAGEQGTDRLHEGFTQIQDADCDQATIGGFESGCRWSVSPGGELGAGGNDVDACYGDSGGPLYLLTENNIYLAGLTSRAYAGVPWDTPCRYGSIYARPDSVLDWIEQVADVTLPRPACNAAPTAEAPSLVVRRGEPGGVQIAVLDPDPENVHTFEVVAEAAHGSATVDEFGAVWFVPDDDYRGDDVLTVRITDDGSIYEASGPLSVDLDVRIAVERRCGCASSSGSWIGLPLLLLGLGVRRRGASAPDGY